MQKDDIGEVETREARWLSRILWVNTGLDVIYILGGLWLFQTWGEGSSLWQGHGVGIIIQGGFLFLFDLSHAFSLTPLASRLAPIGSPGPPAPTHLAESLIRSDPQS